MNHYTLTDLSTQIRAYLIQNVLFGDSKVRFSDDDSLLDLGIIDSSGVMELVMFVEETFGITVEDYEIVPDNFDSVNNLANYVLTKLSTPA